jgi:hypothetical protein
MSWTDKLLGRTPDTSAEAEVLDVEKTDWRLGTPTTGTRAYRWDVRVRVDGMTGPFEATVKEYFAYGTAPDVGARFTLRYRAKTRGSVEVDHDVPGTFSEGAERAPEEHRYGYDHPNGGVPAVVHLEPPSAMVTIDLRQSREQ